MRVFYRILRLCILAFVFLASYASVEAQYIGTKYTFDTAFCINEVFPINLNTITELQLPPNTGVWVDATDGDDCSSVFNPSGKTVGRYEYYFLPSRSVCGLYPGDTISVVIDLFPGSALKDFVFSVCESNKVNLWATILSLPIDTSYITWYDNTGNRLSATNANSVTVGDEDITQFYYKIDDNRVCDVDSGFVYFNLDDVPYDLSNTGSERVSFCSSTLPDMINLNDVIGGVLGRWKLKDYATQPTDLQDLIDESLDGATGVFSMRDVLTSSYRKFVFEARSSSSCGVAASNRIEIVIEESTINFAELGGDTLRLCNSEMATVYNLNRYLNTSFSDGDVRWTSNDIAAQSFIDTSGVLDARTLVPGFYTFTATYTKDRNDCGIVKGAQTNIYLSIEELLEFGTIDLLTSMCYTHTINLSDVIPSQLGLNVKYELENPSNKSLKELTSSEVESFSPSNFPSIIASDVDTTYKIIYSFTDDLCTGTTYKDTIYLSVFTGNDIVNLTDKEFYSCYLSAGQINLNNVLGYYGSGAWASQSSLDYFDASTGIFYGKTQYVADNNGAESVYEFTFTPDNGNPCLMGVAPVTVKVTLTDDLNVSVPTENADVVDTIRHEDRRPINLLDYVELSPLEGYWTVDSINVINSTVLDLEDIVKYPVGKYTYTYVVPANGEHCVAGTSYFNVALVVLGSPLEVFDSLLPIVCNGDNNGGIYLDIRDGSKPYEVLLTKIEDDAIGSETVIYSGTLAAERDTTFSPLEGVYQLRVIDLAKDTFINTYSIVRPDPIVVNEISLHNVTSDRQNNGVLELRITGGRDPYYAIVVENCDPTLETCDDFLTDSVIWSQEDATHRYFLSYDSLAAGDYNVFVMDSSRYYYYQNDEQVTDSLSNLNPDVCTIDTSFTITNDPLMLDCPDTLSVYGGENCDFSIPNIKALVEFSGGAEDYDLTIMVQDPETGEYITDILPSDFEKYYTVNVYALVPNAGGAVDAAGSVILDTLADCQVVLEVNCRKDIMVGQLVTPNNDGNNDTWLIEGLERYPNHSIKVYGRWGDLVFENTNYANDWGASCNTANCIGKGTLPAGTYFWVIDLGEEGNNEVVKGFMEVVY
ncbi:MAG: gliding motility-associated C-terminal domain-containing protein [Bacteroidales bacterium]